MPRVLAIADEVVAGLWTESVRQHDSIGEVELVLAAGDLPFDYVDYLSSTLNQPCVLVPGNHDPDLSGYHSRRGLFLRCGLPDTWPGPPGAVNCDGRVVDVAGLRIAGLGGSVRYRDGPNQWTQAQQRRRAHRLEWLAGWRRLRDGRRVDVLLTHAPPRHCGDRDDLPHNGFDCLHRLVRRLRPRLLVHGHIHPHGEPVPDRQLGDTLVVNAVGYRVLRIAANEREETDSAS